MATVGDVINGALRLIGQLAEGEEPSPETSADGVSAFRAMVESFNNESLQIYQIQDEVFTLPASVTYQTIGVGGDFSTTWPIKILDSTFTRNNTTAPNVDFGLQVINNDQYSAIPVKTVTGPYPQYLYYERSYPLGKLYFWPVPILALELHLSTWKPLTDVTGLTTGISLPPGYERALRYSLAIELAPEFGVEPSPTVVKIASKARENLRRVNGQSDVMSLPDSLPGLGSRFSYYSIYRGMP